MAISSERWEFCLSSECKFENLPDGGLKVTDPEGYVCFLEQGDMRKWARHVDVARMSPWGVKEQVLEMGEQTIQLPDDGTKRKVYVVFKWIQ